MNSYRKFKLYGESELTQIRVRLDRAVSEWRSRWFPEVDCGQTASVPTLRDIADLGLSDEVWRPIQAQDGRVSFAWSNRAALQIFSYALGIDKVGFVPSEMAEDFVLRVVEDLLDFVPPNPTPTAPPNSMNSKKLPPFLGQKASGGILVRIFVGNVDIALAIDQETVTQNLISMSLSADDKATVEMQPLESVLSERSISFEARLRPSILDYASLRKLAVGDVLMCEQSIHEPLDIHVVGGQKIGQAYPGRTGHRRAVRLVTQTNR